MFGDIALITGNQRSATVVCKTDCYFATLNLHNYNLILKKDNMRKYSSKSGFFYSIVFGSHIEDITLMEMVKGFVHHSYPKPTTIFKEGDPVRNIYVIKRGEITIHKRIKIETEETDVKTIYEDSYEVMQKCNTKFKMKNIRFITIKVAVLKRGQMFGVMDYFLKGNRTYSATCKKNTMLYSLSNE